MATLQNHFTQTASLRRVAKGGFLLFIPKFSSFRLYFRMCPLPDPCMNVCALVTVNPIPRARRVGIGYRLHGVVTRVSRTIRKCSLEELNLMEKQLKPSFVTLMSGTSLVK